MAQLIPTWPDAGDENWDVPLIGNLNDMVDLLNTHDAILANGGGNGSGGGGSTVNLVDNGDGTFTITGTNVIDNGDGTITIA